MIEFRATKDQMAAFLDNPTGVDLKALEKQGVPFATAFLARTKADADVYTNHVGVLEEMLGRSYMTDLATLVVKTENTDIDGYNPEDFDIVGYEPQPFIKLEVAV